jgi:hypothetical protein
MATAVHENNLFEIVLVTLGGFLTFLPLYLNVPSVTNYTAFSSALRTNTYRDSCIANLALVTPIILDKALDLIDKSFAEDKVSSTRTAKPSVYDCSFNYREKLLFLMGLIVQPITVFLSPDTSNLNLIVICARNCRRLLVVGSLTCMFSRQAEVISKPAANLCIILFVTALVMGSFSSNIASSSEPNGNSFVIYVISSAIGSVASFIWLVCCVWWLIKIAIGSIKDLIFHHRISLHGDGNASVTSIRGHQPRPSADNADRYLSFRVGFVCVVVTWAVINLSIRFSYMHTCDLTEAALAIENLSFILLELSRVAFVMRIVKFEAVQGLVSD